MQLIMHHITCLALMVLFLLNYVNCHDEENDIKIRSELELIQWDLQDECSDMARNEKIFFRRGITGLRDKIRGEVDHANFLRLHSQRLKAYEEVPYEVQRNWTYFTKCGDVLLSADEFTAFTVFANKNLQFKLTDKVEFLDEIGTKSVLSEQGVMDELATRRNVTQLKDIWMKWESGTKPFKEWYHVALKLVSKATLANDYNDVQSYWEMLSEVQDGYELGKTLFESVQSLYYKLHSFVRLRLNKHYNTTHEGYIPTYLTGSFLGDDWSHLAPILLPNPQLYYDMKVELEARNIEDFYKYAGNMSKNLGFGEFINSAFFKQSHFTVTSCETHILNYCSEQYSSVETCNATNLSTYFDAYETTMMVGLTKVNFYSKVNQDLRFSPILNGLQSMASLISINGMLQNKIIHPTSFTNHVSGEQNKMTVMLLLALRILPKIAYYHAMDKFRLDLLENHAEVEDVYKKHMQEVMGLIIGDEKDAKVSTSEYLRDEMILFNKPYLSKMLGQFLQFQLFRYYQIDLFEEADISTLFNKDTTFRDFILNIPNSDASNLLSYYYNIDEITDYALLTFFAPLAEYLELAPLDQSEYKLKTTKFIRATTTTTTSKPQTRKSKTIVTSSGSQQDGGTSKKVSSDAINSETKLDKPQSSIVKIEVTSEDFHSEDDNLRPAQNNAHLGIYIGAGIVIITFLIIAAAFVAQRRRSQQINRRYNA